MRSALVRRPFCRIAARLSMVLVVAGIVAAAAGAGRVWWVLVALGLLLFPFGAAHSRR
jgi:hypothetical protein